MVAQLRPIVSGYLGLARAPAFSSGVATHTPVKAAGPQGPKQAAVPATMSKSAPKKARKAAAAVAAAASAPPSLTAKQAKQQRKQQAKGLGKAQHLLNTKGAHSMPRDCRAALEQHTGRPFADLLRETTETRLQAKAEARARKFAKAKAKAEAKAAAVAAGVPPTPQPSTKAERKAQEAVQRLSHREQEIAKLRAEWVATRSIPWEQSPYYSYFYPSRASGGYSYGYSSRDYEDDDHGYSGGGGYGYGYGNDYDAYESMGYWDKDMIGR